MAGQMILSTLHKTWIFDLDGTMVKHNGYLLDGADQLLDGVKAYIGSIPKEDRIIILTSRKEEYRAITTKFLDDNGVRYDVILFDMPMGERIVVNDRKPSGIDMAVAINCERDRPDLPKIIRVM